MGKTSKSVKATLPVGSPISSMRILLLLLYIIFFSVACNNTKTPISDTKSKSINSDSVKDISNHELSNSGADQVPDFLAIGKSTSTSYQGYLHGVEKSDSSGPYFFKQYFGDTLTFELIIIPKRGDKKDVKYDSIISAASNNYADYICFAFVYKMKDPDSMRDYHASNVEYPTNVKAYVKKNEKWSFISQSLAKNITQLSKYKIQTIFSNMN